MFFNYGYLDSEYTEFDADISGDAIVNDNSGLTLRNTSDERYVRVILIPPVSNFGQWNEPRNYGVELTMEF